MCISSSYKINKKVEIPMDATDFASNRSLWGPITKDLFSCNATSTVIVIPSSLMLLKYGIHCLSTDVVDCMYYCGIFQREHLWILQLAKQNFPVHSTLAIQSALQLVIIIQPSTKNNKIAVKSDVKNWANSYKSQVIKYQVIN